MKFAIRAITCAALLSGVSPVRPAELGRLFFTPEQRKELERHQQENASNGHTLTVNGIVQKTGGGRTVWINGVPQTADSISEHAADEVSVALPGQAKPTEVKVGQKLSLPPAEP